MAPRGRRKKAGLMREDAARDAMRAFGFQERVISMCIKELLELYDGEWFLIEEFSYSVLLNKCLEKQAELDNHVAEEEGEEEEEEMLEEQNEEMAHEEEEEMVEEQQNEEMTQEEEVEEEEQHVEDVRDYVGSNSTSLLGTGAATGATRCGWLSDEEETDLDEGSVVDDDDDEMIQLTPEPLCEELKELLGEVRGEEKKRKRPTRWDT